MINSIFSSLRSQARQLIYRVARQKGGARPLIISIIILALVWCYAVVWKMPTNNSVTSWLDRYLSELSIKLLITIIILVFLGLYYYFRRGDEPAVTAHDADGVEEKLNLQDKIFDQFIAESQEKLGDFEVVKKMPFYLVCGMGQAGASSFITSSNTPLAQVSAAKVSKKYNVSQEREGLEILFNKQAVIFDVPGDMLKSKGQDADKLWENLGDNVLSLREQMPLNGVVLVLDLIALTGMPAKERKQFALQVRERVGEVNKKCGSGLPVYVVVTKLDLVEGFEGFTRLLDDAALNDAFGFSFSLNMNNPDHWVGEIEANFSKFVDSLYLRVFEAFANTVSGADREVYYHFIRNISGIKTILLQFLGEVLEENDFLFPPNVRGLYFVSNTQQGVITNFHKLAVAKKYHLPLPALNVGKHLKERSYFSKEFFKRIILQESGISLMNQDFLQQRHKRLITNLLAVGLIGGLCATLIYQAAERDEEKIEAAVAELDVFNGFNQPPYAGSRLKYLDSGLDALDAAYQAYPKRASWLSLNNLGIHDQEFHDALRDKYEAALSRFFLPNIGETLAQEIAKPNYNQEEKLNILKLYSMIQDKPRRDVAFATGWLKTYWTQQKSNTTLDNQSLNQHFLYAITHVDTDISSLEPRFAPYKALYAQQTPAERLYDSLKQHKQFAARPVDLAQVMGSGYEKIFVTNDLAENALVISGLFTPEGYSELFGAGFKDNLKNSLVDEWAISGIENYSDEELGRLKTSVTKLYADEYINTWRTALSNLKIRPSSDLDGYAEVVQAIVSSEQPLEKLVASIYENTHYFAGEAFLKAHESDPALKNLTYIADGFAEVNRLPQDQLPEQALLQDINTLVTQLSSEVEPGRASFQIVENRENKDNALIKLASKADTVPLPFSSIYQQIAADGQSIIWREALTYVNQMWSQDVYRVYEEKIATKYPFAKMASQSVNVSDFSSFFSPQGSLYEFASEFLPFIEQSQSYIRSNLPNVKVADSIDAKLDRLLVLGNAFYSGDGNFGLRLTVTPKGLSANYLRAVMNIDGQIINYGHERSYPVALIWPNTLRNDVQSKVNLIGKNGKGAVFTSSGAWSLFDLFAQAKYIPVTDTLFLLEFETRGGKMVYEVELEGNFNPFSQSNFELNLPQTIYRFN